MITETKTFLQPLTIRSLLDQHFFIPDYQRGYRWTTAEVNQLMEDIANFVPNQINIDSGKTWYCLQPLVVKQCSLEKKKVQQLDPDKQWYEVIDGQQRLTTIFLIGHYINEMWRGKQKDTEITLRYQTRAESAKFLSKLHVDENNEIQIDRSNIDFYHISSAYNAIHQWVENNASFERDSFMDKLINHTKVIWYETDEVDANVVFRRLNTGKIPLTNAELVKALFLNSSNFKDVKGIKIRQFEVANEWDQIEYALQEDDFWYFLNKEDNDVPTRIAFILDLHSGKRKDNNQQYFTFDFFSKKFRKHTSKEITDNWNAIKRTFQILNEWFRDPDMHNKIGFLIYCGVDITGILEDYKAVSKKEFRSNLVSQIEAQMEDVNINTLSYKSENLQKLRKLFLLYNIETMLINQSDSSKFPFRKFKDKKNGWDIEHINSVAEKVPKSDQHRKDWIDETLPFVKDDVLREAMINFSEDTFEELFNKAIHHFYGGLEEGIMNDPNALSNLTLLDSKTNRGYQNAVFPKKRSTILEKDKLGHFIPQCTKNLFMKYYSNDPSHMTFWGVQDREDYFDDLESTLKPYLKPIAINE